MIDLAIGAIQRSIVEIDILDGERLEDEPRFDVDATAEHYAATGRLLITEGVLAALDDACESYDTMCGQKGDPALYRAACGLMDRAREAT